MTSRKSSRKSKVVAVFLEAGILRFRTGFRHPPWSTGTRHPNSLSVCPCFGCVVIKITSISELISHIRREVAGGADEAVTRDLFQFFQTRQHVKVLRHLGLLYEAFVFVLFPDCRSHLKHDRIKPVMISPMLGQKVTTANKAGPTGFGFGSPKPKLAKRMISKRGATPTTKSPRPIQNSFDNRNPCCTTSVVVFI